MCCSTRPLMATLSLSLSLSLARTPSLPHSLTPSLPHSSEVRMWYQKLTALVKVDGPVLQVEVLTSEKKELDEKVKSLSENIRLQETSDSAFVSVVVYPYYADVPGGNRHVLSDDLCGLGRPSGMF